MQRKTRARRVRILALLACTSGFLPGIGLAADQSYLNALENEADHMDAVESTPQTKEPTLPKVQTTMPEAPKETLTAGMSMADFESELQNNFFGSYLFYSKLSDAGKANVYQEYQKDNDVAHLREVIKQELTK